MAKFTFFAGLLLGWLLSALIPTPRWLSHRVDSLVEAGRDKVGSVFQRRQKEIKGNIRDDVEERAVNLEKELR